MLVRQITVGQMANFVYLVQDEASKQAMIIDSGWETEPLVSAAREIRAEVRFAVATHEHFDHTTTLGEVAAELGAKVVAHVDSPIDHEMGVKNGDVLKLGKGLVRILHTPGHTHDSICLLTGGNLFTGDTLFMGTIGKFDRGACREMFESLHGVIMSLPDSTMIYPGHDYGDVPYRTLGIEKATNPFLQPKDARSFQSIFC